MMTTKSNTDRKPSIASVVFYIGLTSSFTGACVIDWRWALVLFGMAAVVVGTLASFSEENKDDET